MEGTVLADDDAKPEDAAVKVKPAPKAAPAPEAAPSVRLSFQTFATALDPATRNAFRVYLGLKHSDVGQEFAEPELQAKLDAMHNNVPNQEG